MRLKSIFLSVVSLFFTLPINATELNTLSKEASAATQSHFNEVKNTLPFNDTYDFELMEKGLLLRPESVMIKDDQGNVVWHLGQYNFLLGEQEFNTINPSLTRQATLNMSYGLYQVTDRIYQVRGYDLANMTFIKGDTGWIVFDTLLTPPTAKAAFDLVTEHFGRFPIHAVIYSHAHADHFGGVRGIVSQQDVDNGKVQIIAPNGFMEHAIKENILAGNAMARRTTYQYGNALPVGPKGQVDAAIGKGTSLGEVSLIAPTKEIVAASETLIIDGVVMEFLNTPDTESPAEMNTYFPQFKALWSAENVIATMHNIYTLRGAHARDALAWSKYINQLIHGAAKEAEVLFASHSWPRWGNAYLLEVLKKQRDLYGYLHNQTLNLANKGITISEIHNEFEIPDVLAHEWYNRGYHGSYSHNVRGIINKYLGFFDMNPATLDKLSPSESGARYVTALGGPDALLAMAADAAKRGDYRWAAELLNHLIFSDPDNKTARLLQADVFEQMGYQAESAGWRNIYLAGAFELRHGIPTHTKATRMGPDLIEAMTTELIFDFLAVKLNAKKAHGKHFTVNFIFPDRNEFFLVELENSNLNNIEGVQNNNADVTITINRTDFNKLITNQNSFAQLVAAKQVKLAGDINIFAQLMSMFDEFPFWFNIATP